MNLYSYSKINNEFLGVLQAREDPKTPGRFLHPANTTEVEPPGFGVNEIPVFVSGAWIVKPDYRGVIYNTTTLEPQALEDIGEIPAGFTDIEPPSQFHTWDATEWVLDLAAELLSTKESKLSELKTEGLSRMNAVYSDDVFLTVGMVEILIDIDATYDKSGSVAPRLVSANAVLTAFKPARDAINELTTKAEVDAYDVVTDPVWP
ncbi:MAG: tail fiber assembly protein [Planctomycetes bacterium]|nr:tail fiber assembly protein [Planctomycetota bacterium]